MYVKSQVIKEKLKLLVIQDKSSKVILKYLRANLKPFETSLSQKYVETNTSEVNTSWRVLIQSQLIMCQVYHSKSQVKFQTSQNLSLP